MRCASAFAPVCCFARYCVRIHAGTAAIHIVREYADIQYIPYADALSVVSDTKMKIRAAKTGGGITAKTHFGGYNSFAAIIFARFIL